MNDAVPRRILLFTKKFAPAPFGLILSGLMYLLVSAISSYRAVGFGEGYIPLWTSAWLTGWLVAFPVVLVVAPVIAMDRCAARGERTVKLRSALLLQRQLQRENAALALSLATRLNRTFVEAGQLPDDRKPDAESTSSLDIIAAFPGEQVEDVPTALRCNTDAVILHADGRAVGFHGRRDSDVPVLWGVLDGV